MSWAQTKLPYPSGRAVAAAKRAREEALDPTVIDAAARTAVLESEFLSQRLRAAMPRLLARLDEIRAQEYATQWRADYAEVRLPAMRWRRS